MTIEEETSVNGKGKKRNPFRRKQNDGSSEHGSDGSSANQRKLRWAQHLGHKDHVPVEEETEESLKSHTWKVPSGKKLHWSPRLGHNKSHGGANNEDLAAEDESKEAPRKHPWNKAAKNQLGLHWSPQPGRKKRDGGDTGDCASSDKGQQDHLRIPPRRGHTSRGASVSDGYSSENGSPQNGDLGIPRQVGGSPAHCEDGGANKKFLWHQRNAELSDSLSDDTGISEGSIKNEKVADRMRRIHQKLKGKKAHWRYRLGEHRIDEEEEQHLTLGNELDPLEGFYQQSIAGDLEIARDKGALTFAKESRTYSLNRGRSSTEPCVTFAGLDDRHYDHRFQRVHSLDGNTSPRNIPVAGSCDSDITSLRGSHSDSTSSFVSDTVANIRRDSDIIKSLGAAPGLLTEDSPVRNHSKASENKEFRVKPFHCFDPAVYMTEPEIHEFMLQPSQNVEFLESYIAPSTKRTTKIKVSGETERFWGTTDDGRVGSLRVEVLGCIGLASVKPDVSAYLICGDVPFVTDVIPSCRSPRWPPNCKRAAVFPVHHAYARLFAGVFASKKDKANDEFCGRVVLDLAALRPNTEYDVTLPLRASSFIYDRRPRGVIRLRFSLHWFSERAAVWSYLKSPHSLVTTPFGDNPSVLCGDPKTFRNVAITVHGQDLPGQFTRKAFQATMREFNLTRVNLIVSQE